MPARSWAQVGPGGPRLDLALDMVDGGGALELTLEYNADLFSERSMRQMAGHYLARHPAIPRWHACRSQWSACDLQDAVILSSAWLRIWGAWR